MANEEAMKTSGRYLVRSGPGYFCLEVGLGFVILILFLKLELHLAFVPILSLSNFI